MSTTRAVSIRREIPLAFLAAIAFVLLVALLPGAINAQGATPSPSSCEDVMPSTSTPMAGHGAMGASTPEGHEMGEMEMGGMVEFDLAYIDMMIPHHQSIIALAQVATPELSDPRLIEMAEAIIATQAEEIDEWMSFWDEWYPNTEPVSMDQMMMALPSMASSSMSMESMQQLMSPEALVTTFCVAEDKDLAFIELTIPHHQMAIDASEDAVENAEHEDLVEIAEDVITAQQQEIDLLMEIHADLTGEATLAN